jgi:hypothetical protein
MKMTDREFNLLKAKIQVAKEYLSSLEHQYQRQTGARYHASGPLPLNHRSDALDDIREDLGGPHE